MAKRFNRKRYPKAHPTEAAARVINGRPWQPPPGYVKRRCSRCFYWFSNPTERDDSRCFDCASYGQRSRR